MIAAGKTPGQLQNELQTNYNTFYVNLTVTVVPKDRYFYVEGEVNRRGPCLYLGEADIVSAISAAGGFTEFAKKTKIRLMRGNEKVRIIDYNKALKEGATYKVLIYPGDRLVVPRRWF